METIKDRLEQFAVEQGLRNLYGLETAAGLNRNTLYKIGAGLNTTTLAKIAEKFPTIDLNWIILGRRPDAVEKSPTPPLIIGQNVESQTVAVSISNLGELQDMITKAIKEAVK